MRIFVALSTAALLLWSAGSIQAQWDVLNNDGPNWKMEASVIALDRQGDDNGIPLISDSLTLETLFDSGQATDLNSAAGMEISLQFINRFGVEMEIEGEYAQWDRSDTFLGPNLETSFLPGSSPNEINYQFASNLFSLEWNGRRQVTPGVTLILGPRFVYLDERIQFDTTTTVTPPVPLPIFDVDTQSIIETKNPLFGGQIGAEFEYLLTRDLAFQAHIKAGGYANFSSAVVQRSTTGFDDTLTESSKSAGSFVGEVGGRIYYYVSPSACALYAGYEATWIDNVASAPVQFYTVDNPDNDVILGDSPFIQGVVFGVEFLR